MLVPAGDRDRRVKLVAVDFDAPEITSTAVWTILPKTCGWGRESKPLSQVLYVSPQEKSVTHVDHALTKEETKKQKAMLVELRAGPGMQSMAPPSIHPCGEQLEWVEDLPEEPTAVVPESLLRSVGLLATYAMVARWYPAEGARHYWMLYLGGFLRSLGLTVEEATLIADLARRHVRDPDERDRLDAVQRSFVRADEERIGGSKKIIEEMGDRGKGFVATLRKIWGSSGGLEAEGDKLKKNQQNIRKALDQMSVKLSFDQFAEQMLVQNGTAHVLAMDDDHLRHYWLALEVEFGFLPTKEYFQDVVREIAWQNKFHPVLDYLSGLKWDGTPRVDKWLVTYAKAKDDAYTRAVGSLVLVAAVRRVRQPGCKFDELLVLESGQGLDKSSALRALCPRTDWFSDDLPLAVDAKQMIERTTGRWIIEVAELVGSKRESDHIKASLSRQEDGPVRLAYGRVATSKKRQFIVIGTTNEGSYIRDRTGGRRFWPVTVRRFDVKGILRDRDQLWAEAAHREAAGESIRLDPALYAEARAAQDARLVEEAWEGPLTELTDGLQGAKQRVSNDAIWAALGIPMTQRDDRASSRVASIMQRMGFRRMTVKNGEEKVVRGWGRDLVDGIWRPGGW